MLKPGKALLSLRAKIALIAVIAASLFVTPVFAQSARDVENTVSFYYGKEGQDDGLFVTHGGNVPLPMRPEGIGPMRGFGPVNQGFTMMSKIRNENDEVIGVVGEIEYFPEAGGRGKEWEAWWFVYIPGVGSLVGYEIETQPFHDDYEMRDTIARGEDWNGEWQRRMAHGPREDGWGYIVGGTGEWEGATGRFSEIVLITQLTAEGRRTASYELRFILD